MSPFDSPPPDFDLPELDYFAETHFGISGSIAPLPGERDQNCLVTSASGDRFVMKIAHRNEDRGQLELQTAALLHLAKRDSGLGTPRVCPTQNSEFMAEISGADGAVHCLRLLTYLPGRLLKRSPRSPALLRNLGAFMGRLDRALQDFRHGAAARPDFLWNLDRALACRPHLAEIADPEQRALVERVFARHETNVAPRLAGLRTSVIHQDANDHNVLLDPGAPVRVTGLIDFGDMLSGRQINELAVTLAYALFECEDPLATAAPVIAGFHGELPLLEEELAVLFDLIALRLAMSVSISAWRSKQHPDNEYLLVSQESSFALLGKLERIDPQAAQVSFREACGLPRG